MIPKGSQVLLYLGEDPDETLITVPDFSGMTRQQASDAAGKLGLYILPAGNTDISPKILVTDQSIAPGTKVPVGTTITLTFTDTYIRD
jgi:beta-lactam-binding protein with PASTA domain